MAGIRDSIHLDGTTFTLRDPMRLGTQEKRATCLHPRPTASKLSHQSALPTCGGNWLSRPTNVYHAPSGTTETLTSGPLCMGSQHATSGTISKKRIHPQIHQKHARHQRVFCTTGATIRCHSQPTRTQKATYSKRRSQSNNMTRVSPISTTTTLFPTHIKPSQTKPPHSF